MCVADLNEWSPGEVKIGERFFCVHRNFTLIGLTSPLLIGWSSVPEHHRPGVKHTTLTQAIECTFNHRE